MKIEPRASSRRHPRVGGDPRKFAAWMPVDTGMTNQ
jgi:hypothetical protein